VTGLERADGMTVGAIAEQRTGRWSRFMGEMKGHSTFWVFALAVLVASIMTKSAVLDNTAADMIMAVVGFVLFWPGLLPALLPMVFFNMAVFEKSQSPVRDLYPALKRYLAFDGRFFRGLTMMLVIYAFINGFSSFKSLISYIQPFNWDQTFDEWDRVLHFGYRPWEILHPVLAYPPVTALININYNFWFITLSMFWLHFSFVEKPGFRRTQAVIAYMLTWSVGGILLAILFSSAGPCYFGKVVPGASPYADLMMYLRSTSQSWPVWAIDLQDTLWMNYTLNHGIDVAKGISAMPSMHNAQSLLLIFVTWNRSRLVRNLAIAHGVLVFLGSIHLGWHYAVDAYLAFAIASAAWVAATYFARRAENRQPAAAVAC
jgi:PAP2 superfamily